MARVEAEIVLVSRAASGGIVPYHRLVSYGWNVGGWVTENVSDRGQGEAGRRAGAVRSGPRETAGTEFVPPGHLDRHEDREHRICIAWRWLYRQASRTPAHLLVRAADHGRRLLSRFDTGA